jgi:DNA-binding MarR family transcriptional regulator
MGSRDRKQSGSGASGRFAYEGLDRAIHEKARLGILTSLAAHRDGLPFNHLKELCALTDGNLNRHLAVLEEAGLIEMTRSTGKGRPKTTVALTNSGRQRFGQYISVLEQVVKDAARSRRKAEAGAAKLSAGWSPA